MTREEITQKIRSKGYTAVFEAIPPQFPEDHIEDEDPFNMEPRAETVDCLIEG